MDRSRCSWCGVDPIYVAYHDDEWGVVERGDRALFEKLALDGFQAGLSWITILRKRDAFRRAFEGFEPQRVARLTEADVRRLLADRGIVRHRGKIEATITNAQAYLRVMERHPGGFSGWLWELAGGAPEVHRYATWQEIPAETPRSRAMARALKGEGFRFVGPTICYAFMQAVGMVNDHVISCFRHAAPGGQ